MNGFLDRLEHELIDATKRGALASGAASAPPISELRESSRTSSAGAAHRLAEGGLHRLLPARTLTFRLAALAVPLALVLAGVALAATGVIFSGAPVPPAPHLTPRVGVGIPAPGRSRLIAHSVSDPAGGLPWSMRIVHTTRGLVCLQIGRLHGGQVGVIGEDGAFRDDGLFHRLPARQIAPSPLYDKFAVSCNPEGVTSEQELLGVLESGEFAAEGASAPSAAQRRIYFGLLGRNALGIAYRVGGKTRTAPVERGTGAYLIVLRGTGRSLAKAESGASFGYPTHEEARIRAGAPLTAIVYRLSGGAGSRTCTEAGVQSVSVHACPREPWNEEEERAPRDLHVPIDVTLKPMSRSAAPRTKDARPLGSRGAVDGVHYTASVSFKAPLAISNATASYIFNIESPHCRTSGGGPKSHVLAGSGGTTIRWIARDVRKGAIVHVREANVFANDLCGKPVTIKISYNDIASGEGELIGKQVVREP